MVRDERGHSDEREVSDDEEPRWQLGVLSGRIHEAWFRPEPLALAKSLTLTEGHRHAGGGKFVRRTAVRLKGKCAP